MKKSVNLYVDLGTKPEEGTDALTTQEKLLLMKRLYRIIRVAIKWD